MHRTLGRVNAYQGLGYVMKLWKNFRDNGFIVHIIFITFMVAVVRSSGITVEQKIEKQDPVDAGSVITITEKAAPFIEVYSEKGVVTLCGKVQTVSAKEQAEKIASGISGTRAVVNMISVQPIERADVAIKQDVVKAFGSDSLLEDCTIVAH